MCIPKVRWDRSPPALSSRIWSPARKSLEAGEVPRGGKNHGELRELAVNG